MRPKSNIRVLLRHTFYACWFQVEGLCMWLDYLYIRISLHFNDIHLYINIHKKRFETEHLILTSTDFDIWHFNHFVRALQTPRLNGTHGIDESMRKQISKYVDKYIGLFWLLQNFISKLHIKSAPDQMGHFTKIFINWMIVRLQCFKKNSYFLVSKYHPH